MVERSWCQEMISPTIHDARTGSPHESPTANRHERRNAIHRWSGICLWRRRWSFGGHPFLRGPFTDHSRTIYLGLAKHGFRVARVDTTETALAGVRQRVVSFGVLPGVHRERGPRASGRRVAQSINYVPFGCGQAADCLKNYHPSPALFDGGASQSSSAHELLTIRVCTPRSDFRVWLHGANEKQGKEQTHRSGR